MKGKLIIAVFLISLIGTVSAFAMSTNDFDDGLSLGIYYFNNGDFYTAKDCFQRFCDNNWGNMNGGQQTYAIGWLDSAKRKINELENAAKILTTEQFDEGLRTGIDFYNRHMYYEAKDVFQWFCDDNWGKMNGGQQTYALGWLDASKARISDSYVTMYGVDADGFLENQPVYIGDVELYKTRGWSINVPKPWYTLSNFEAEDIAYDYLLSCLYYPNSLIINDAYIWNATDDFDRENGYVTKAYYVDFYAMDDYTNYIRTYGNVYIWFNSYSGYYSIWDDIWEDESDDYYDDGYYL